MEPREQHPTSEQPPPIEAETLSRVLHDLCNPLATMRIRSQLLKRNIERGRIQEAHESLSEIGEIEDMTRRMEATLNDLWEACTGTSFAAIDQSRWSAPDGGSLAGPHHRENGQHDE